MVQYARSACDLAIVVGLPVPLRQFLPQVLRSSVFLRRIRPLLTLCLWVNSVTHLAMYVGEVNRTDFSVVAVDPASVM
jgi:hypothetical protein